MASEIYSRYIPPSKVKTRIQSPTIQDSPSSLPNLASPPTTKDASSSYLGYTPPVNSSRNPQTSVAQESLSPPSKRKHDDLVEEQGLGAQSAKRRKSNIPEQTNSTLSTTSPRARRSSELDTAKTTTQHKSLAGKRSQSRVEDQDDDARHNKLLRKRERSLKKTQQFAKQAEQDAFPDDEPEEPIELHDLVPLPQPEPVPELPQQPLSTVLPSWLAKPIRISPALTTQFTQVGVSGDVEAKLHKKGFKEAFAVQAALLPALLPGPKQEDGDFLVSAATGSGKTLSYILPMIENISHNHVTKLRGLIVLPTRELVTQAKEVSEMCASFFPGTRRLRIGVAVGNETFKTEQAFLMEQEMVYDPAGYTAQLECLNKKWGGSDLGFDDDLCDEEKIFDLPDHVIQSSPKVDILICTPGRLVEHLRSTAGFALQDVQWLVVDEADKLLDQSFQDWLDVVMVTLRKPRKIILSATITRDIGKLSTLKLNRPRLIVVEEVQDAEAQTFVLPATLKELAIKVDDEGVKPLYLLEILQRGGLADEADPDNSASSSPGDSSSDENHFVDGETQAVGFKQKPSQGALIFTKSNESAVRLGRLIALLRPALSNRIGILTSTTRSSDRKAALKSFESGQMSIFVASDLVSRGLDLSRLAHVINYDIPTSLTSYVHRVGRTARAGRVGYAWTLITSAEGRWFWTEIGKAEGVTRATKVERLKLNASRFDRSGYEESLHALGKESTEGWPHTS